MQVWDDYEEGILERLIRAVKTENIIQKCIRKKWTLVIRVFKKS